MAWTLVEDGSHKKTWLDKNGAMVSVETYRPEMEPEYVRGAFTKRVMPNRDKGLARAWSYKVKVTPARGQSIKKAIATTPESAVQKARALMLEYGAGRPPEINIFDIPAPAALMKAKKKEMKAKIAGVDVAEKATERAYKMAGGKRKLKFEKV